MMQVGYAVIGKGDVALTYHRSLYVLVAVACTHQRLVTTDTRRPTADLYQHALAGPCVR